MCAYNGVDIIFILCGAKFACMVVHSLSFSLKFFSFYLKKINRVNLVVFLVKKKQQLYLLWFSSLSRVINHSVFLYTSGGVAP